MITAASLEQSPHARGLTEHVESLCLVLVAVMGALILCAWWVPGLAAHLPGAWNAMKANAAFGMLLAAAGLALPGGSSHGYARHASRLLGACLFLLAAVTLVEHLLDASLGVDTWLAADPASQRPGRMSAQVALGLALVALAVLGMDARRGAASLLMDLTALVLAGLMLTLVAAWLLVRVGIYSTSAAVHTAPLSLLCLVLLAFVVCSRRTAAGLLAVLRGGGIGSRIARLAVPVAVVLPFVLVLLRGYVTFEGVLSAVVASALSFAFICLSAAGLVLLMARRINHLERRVLDLSLKESREALHDSQQRYGELVEQALEGILVRRHSGEILYVNAALCEMLGYSREEFSRMSIRDLVHPEDLETVEQVQALGDGGALRLDKRMRCKDGRVLNVQVSARRLANGDVQSTVQDVTEVRRAEERFQAMVEGSPNAMLMVNERGLILLANPQAEQLFGYGRGELLGAAVEALIPMRARGQHPALRAGFHRDPKPRRMGAGRDLFGVRKDGREIPVEIGLNPVTTREGLCVMASVIDITERLQAQEAMRGLPKQLLDAQEKERRRIARELHDEVGQALTAAQIKLRDLEAQLKGAHGAQETAEISAMVAALLQQIRQLSLDLRPSILDDLGLGPAIRWFVRERVPQSHMQVELAVPLTLPRAPVAIETALFRAFQSSITNVLRHAEASSVSISLGFEADRLILEVRDDGKGFDLSAARRRARQGGSLGLLGMEEWIRLSGGEILIESAPGRGTRMRATVPLQEQELQGG